MKRFVSVLVIVALSALAGPACAQAPIEGELVLITPVSKYRSDIEVRWDELKKK
jgi:hypothetical protein